MFLANVLVLLTGGAMEIRASERGIALAIFGILVSLVLAILAALRAPAGVIVACSATTVVLIVAIYVPTMRGFYWNIREELQRQSRRKAHNLRNVAGDEADSSPQDLPDGVYGYEEIFSVMGLRSGDARLKPDRTNTVGYPYPLEVHKFSNDTWLVGYVSREEKQLVDNATETGQLSLSMRRTKTKGILVEIPLSRVIGNGESRGDRSWDSFAKNLYRLILPLASAPEDTEARPLNQPEPT
jgi:hypothetical protein